MTEAYLYDHVRTPRGKGKPDGALHEITPIQLATQMLQAIRDRSRLDTRLVEDVILGCVVPVGEQGGNIARIAALNADFAQTVPGVQINRYCGSGLEAVNFAAAKIRGGLADLVIGGGVESMSRIPMGADGGAWAMDPQVANKTYFVMQGISADLLATKYGLTRQDCDAYAVESQRRAAQAWAEGRFAKSVVPVKDIIGLPVLDHDETVRGDTTMEKLANLKPAFAEMGAKAGFDSIALQRYPQLERIEHMHHAGNSSGIVDGASAVLVGSKAVGDQLGLVPRARIRSAVTVGSEPTIMLDGPAAASRLALRKAGMNVGDIDLFELNEAFSSVVLAFMAELAVPHDRINVNGGAIAMGHPLGATGGMIIGILLDEMERRNLATGLVTLCEAAGMASATIIERV
ncbi:MAG: acetyl-CoA C-acetyltransferase [Rhodocyclaceae bacterium]|jgi:acetyl-CoA C-acetyltransferase|nr:acetyl-CoA C-acetyltransferase [Rhodocyclaceae bacterium]MBK6678433.1 acetyl-CoA C-acetyltransferase [Rhodocyclaceae bacterium]MBK9311526.1 acetyl-CoA C-acetyltransferase [Rhodocyclaceae bacterium]MBK9956365.1 acetyl-CoA C-acetyltransferase [Rhodocyclaceae bacterium]